MSFRRFQIAGALASALACTALLACGENESDDLVAQADEICAEEIAAEPGQVSSDPEQTSATLGKKIELLEQSQAELSELEVPADLEDSFPAFLDAGQARLAAASQNLADLEAGRPASATGKLRAASISEYEAAQEVGLDVCGHGRYADRELEPVATLDDTLARLERAVRTKDCDLLNELDLTTLIDNPPAVCEAIFSDFAGFTVEQARIDDYGLAAVVDYPKNGRPFSQPFVVEGDETYRMMTIFNDQDAAGTETADNAEFDANVGTAVDAIRDEDCRKLGTVYDPEAPFASRRQFCELIFGDFSFAFNTDPEAEPELLGSNAWYAFYKLETERGGAYVLVMSRKDDNDLAAARAGTVYRFSGAFSPFR